jgi:hypothetical protein
VMRCAARSSATGEIRSRAPAPTRTAGASRCPGEHRGNAVSRSLAGAGVLHDKRTIAQQRLDPRPLASRRDLGPEVPPGLHTRRVFAPRLRQHGASPQHPRPVRPRSSSARPARHARSSARWCPPSTTAHPTLPAPVLRNPSCRVPAGCRGLTCCAGCSPRTFWLPVRWSPQRRRVLGRRRPRAQPARHARASRRPRDLRTSRQSGRWFW